MTPTASPPPRTVGLWLAAAACAVTGIVLLAPGLPGATSAAPSAPPAAAAAAPAPAPASTAPPASPQAAPLAQGTELPSSTERPPSASTSRTAVAPAEQPQSGARPLATEEHAHQDEAPSTTSATPLPADQVAGHTDAHAPAADEQQWRPVLTGFATDFTRRGTGTADWAERLSRWTTSQLAKAYTGVDPRRVPAGTLVDVDVSDVGAYTLSFTARYDTGLVVQGQAALGPDRWQVTAAQPATTRSPG